MLKFALAFDQPLPKNNKVVILTRGGGWGVVAADFCNKYRIEVPPLPTDILERLDKLLPFYWSRGNPVDTVAVLDLSIKSKVLEEIGKWNDVGGIIVVGEIYTSFDLKEFFDAYPDMRNKSTLYMKK